MLVVDGDPGILRLITATIEKESYTVIAVTDGKMAFRLLRSGDPVAAVVLDIFMPDINGKDIVKFMRSDPGLKNLPVIIMIVEQGPHLTHKSLAAGTVTFSSKPFTPAQLTAMLRTFVQKRQGVSNT